MTKTLALTCAAALALAACGTAREDGSTTTPDPGAGAAGGGGSGGTVGGSGGNTPTPVDGAALYAADCAGCHGDLATSTKRGATAAQITAAISGNVGGMGAFNTLTADQVAALEAALAPAACTYAYAAWGPCQPDGTQTRTVVSATPAGCTGTPALTQACSYVPPPAGTCTSFTYGAWTPATCPASGQQTRAVLAASPSGCTGGTPVLTQTCAPPPDGAALYAAKCASCHGALASSNLKGKSISVSLIKSKGMTQGLTDAELQAIVTAVGP